MTTVTHRERKLIVLAALAAVGVAAMWTELTKHNDGFDSDGWFYGQMAIFGTTGEHHAPLPWAGRLLTPWLVSQLSYVSGTSILDAFRLLNTAATTVSLIMLWSILRRRSSIRTSLLFWTLYASNFWTLRHAFYAPAYLDAISQCFVVAFWWSVDRGHYRKLILGLAISMLHKESLLLLAPALALKLALSEDASGANPPGGAAVHWSSAGRVARKLVTPLPLLAICAPVATHLLVRFVLANDAGGRAPAPWAYLLPWLTLPDAGTRFLWALASGLGPTWLLGTLALPTFARWASREPSWALGLALALASVFAGMDKARLFLPAWVPMIAWLASVWPEGVARNSDDRSTFPVHLIALATTVFSALAWAQWHRSTVDIHVQVPTYAEHLDMQLAWGWAAMALATLLSWWWTFRIAAATPELRTQRGPDNPPACVGQLTPAS